ncbi:HD domain-containing protein [Clostridium hydrogeniformans]|uniref:HD domain-containing protein n=1 Tax=Clostridium hydrogeniformans TaxID=349933 RepID=UPI00047FA200|nr:HD domain-containing protein [Clostridium hydrogeniformans]
MESNMKDIFKIISLAEKLKNELRHSWLSSGRQESVAEHTWRMSLMAVLIEKNLSKPVNMEKLLKMIIIHDLVEAEAGDVPAFDIMNNEELKNLKAKNELKAIENIKNTLGMDLGEELYNIWIEFENKTSYEAKIANALDKLEVQVQHNEADFSTWIDIEHSLCFMLGQYVEFEPALIELKDIIENEAKEKLKSNGIDVESIKCD